MNEVDALSVFLGGVISKPKRDRYLNLSSREKGKENFLLDLSHVLKRHLVRSCKVVGLSEHEWNDNGYLFTSEHEFGKQVDKLKMAYDAAPWSGGWLLINSSGSSGVLRSDGRIDDEIFLRL